MQEGLNMLVKQAVSGDQKSLETLILRIRDRIYNLALRMLLFPEDAEDATQEILVRIVTHLSTFKEKSEFSTWAFRVASNYLLTARGKKAREFAMPFAAYAEMLDRGQLPDIQYTQNEGEQRLLEEEVKVSCTHGMLLCLSQNGRMAYILGEILEFKSHEGAAIMDISPANFRQLLSRARKRLRQFLSAKCGLVNPQNPCRCRKKVDFLINQGGISPPNYRFAQHSKRSIELVAQITEWERAVAVYRTTPQFAAPETLTSKMKLLLNLIDKNESP